MCECHLQFAANLNGSARGCAVSTHTTVAHSVASTLNRRIYSLSGTAHTRIRSGPSAGPPDTNRSAPNENLSHSRTGIRPQEDDSGSGDASRVKGYIQFPFEIASRSARCAYGRKARASHVRQTGAAPAEVSMLCVCVRLAQENIISRHSCARSLQGSLCVCVCE